jgi:Protein of unknown function (DUF2723)
MMSTSTPVSAVGRWQSLTGAVAGLFAARAVYELDPIRWSILGDWPGAIGLAVLGVVVVYVLFRRSSLDLTPLVLLAVYIIWPVVDLRWACVLLLGAIFLVVQQRLSSDRGCVFTLGLIVFVLYLLTLGDHVGSADTFEWQVVMPQLGIGHPTGYPLFIMLGKLFSWLPLGSMAWRTNLVSATFATLTVLLVFRLLRSLGADRRAAALAALALAGSNVFWSQAVEVEVYALEALLVMLVLGLLVKMLQEHSAFSIQHSAGSKQRLKIVYALFFALGLAITHHLTSVILIPPSALTLILVRPRLRLKAWLTAMGCLLIGLTPWLYIPLRWPALHNGATIALNEWLGWIFGQRFGGALNLSLWSDPTRWSIVGRITLNQFGVVGAVLAAIGLVALFKRAWRAALILLGAFVGYIFYGLVYNVPDVDVFLIPAFVIMAIWIGISLDAGVRYAARSTQYASRVVLIAAALLPLSLIANNYPHNDLRGLRADVEDWGRYVLSLPIPDHAAILVDSEKIAPLYYLQMTEHLRSDLDILVLGDEALYRQELDQRLAKGQPVYLARFLPNLPYRMRSLGPLVEVSRDALMSPPMIDSHIDAAFGNSIDLLGLTAEQGDPYRVTMFWQATSSERKNYHIRLRLIDSTGIVWWEDQGAHPVGGYYPTGAWAQGEIVPDFHEIAVEPFVPTGKYDLEVGLFTPFRPDGLLLKDGTNWLKISQVQVNSQSPESLAHEVRSMFGSVLALTSVDETGDVPPASDVLIRANWSGMPTSAAVLSLVAADGTPVSNVNQSVQSGQSRLMLRAPDQNGLYSLRLKFDQPARCGWLAPLSADCPIGSIEVAGEAIGSAINFDNQVLLTHTKIDRDTLKPNESIKIDLTWRGLKPFQADYTAFVHLLGPDGKVHGQVDQWPVQGTLPTSSWTAGQVVADPYLVTLPPDAPSGKYQIEVGWYLLATLRRLPVLDSSGRPSDDHVIVGEFVVP